jgi:hypothetical protein
VKLKTIGIKAHDQELALEPLVLLSGPNGSGKSTFAEAIRFLALGYVPSLGKRPQDTAALMREPLMAAVLTLPDGRVAGRSLEQTGQGFRARAECSWIEEGGVQRHAAEILSLFGRDEQDVAEALDVRQLLQATPQQREARLAGLISAGRAGPAEKSLRIRRILAELRAERPSDVREAPGWGELLRALPPFPREALAAASRRLEELLRESDPAGLLAWAGEERRRAAARLLLKTKAREEMDARLAPHPADGEEQIRTLEAERERLERDLGALEEKALQLRLREEELDRLRRDLDAARAEADEVRAERARWEARARDLAGAPDELLQIERELDGLVPPPEPESAGRTFDPGSSEASWNEVAAIAEALRELARQGAGSAMLQALAHAQRLGQLSRQALREIAAARAGARTTAEEAERRRAEFDERRGTLLQRRDERRRTLQKLGADDRRTSSALERAQLRAESFEREWRATLGPDEPDELPEADLHRMLHDVRRELAELGALRAARRERDRVAEEEARAQAARDVDATLERALQRLQEEEIMEARDPLGGLVETMLRAAGRTEVPFFSASRGVCRIGWRTASGKEIPAQALSGGEWILFAAALTAAVIILRNAPLRILLVEAGEADPHTLHALLEAIRSVSDRLTCAVVLTPRHVHAPGWTVVRRFGPPVIQSA